MPSVPLVFPEEAEAPVPQVHFELRVLLYQLRVLLYQLLGEHLGPDATVGANQLVYHDAGDPSRCLARPTCTCS